MAATKSKTWTAKITEKRRAKMAVIIVVILVAILLQFRAIAKVVSKVIAPKMDETNQGLVADRVQEVAGALTIGLTGFLILLFMGPVAAIPFIGVGVALLGGAFLVYGAVKFYNAIMPKRPMDIDGFMNKA